MMQMSASRLVLPSIKILFQNNVEEYMATYLDDYVININDDIYYAHWKLHKNKCILIVNNDEGTMEGILTISDLNRTYADDSLKNVRDICNRNCKYLINDEHTYDKARSLFSELSYINHIPVVDENKKLVDIISRQQAFWKQYFIEEKLPRMHYAYCIYMAALEAKTLGYKKISIIEFGVAGGQGLMNCEFHSKAVSRLLDIEIEIYGFDLGNGLPSENHGYMDMIHLFRSGDYKMDYDKLLNKLEFSKLVLGNLKDTTKTFLDKYSPAPIGAMLVDVDYYSSSIPILEFLKNSDEYFLPRIHMYWDDISPEYEFQGESAAICDFNRNNEFIKISPEKEYYQNYRQKTKICHKFTHPKYNEPSDVYVGKGSLRHDKPFFFHELPLTAKQI